MQNAVSTTKTTKSYQKIELNETIKRWTKIDDDKTRGQCEVGKRQPT